MNLTDVYFNSVLMLGLKPTHKKLTNISRMVCKLIVIKYCSGNGQRYYYIYKSNSVYINEIASEKSIINLFKSFKRQDLSYILIDYRDAPHDAKLSCKNAVLRHFNEMNWRE